MGIFTEFKSTYKRSESTLLLKSAFDHHKAMGLLENVNTEKLAERLVSDVWQSKPDVFDGAFGQRPHKISVAAAALAYSLDNLPLKKNGQIRLAIECNLGNILNEIRTNGKLYPLNSLDWVLIESALETLTNQTQEPKTESSNTYFKYYGEWLICFKRAAAQFNSQLELDEDGSSLIDFMDQSPLRRAHSEGVDPSFLAKSFAEQFEINKFGR